MAIYTLLFIMSTLVMGFAGLLLICYVLIKAPPTPIVLAFVIVITFYSMSAILSYYLSVTPHQESSSILAKLCAFTIVMMFASFFVLTFRLIPQDSTARIEKHMVGIVVGSLVLAFVSGLMVEVSQTDLGWSMTPGPGTLPILISCVGFISISTVLLYRSMKLSSDPQQNKQCLLLILAQTSPFIMLAFIALIQFFTGIIIPVDFPTTALPFVLVLCYTVFRYHLIIVVPTREMDVPLLHKVERIFHTQAGVSYLVESKRSITAYNFFLEELRNGSEGLIISWEHPERIREGTRLSKTPIIWLTTQAGADRINPSNLSVVQHVITEFLQRSERPAILFDGIEHLMANNPANKVLLLCQAVRDEVILKEGRMFISIDPRTFEEHSLACFERDFQLIGGMVRPI